MLITFNSMGYDYISKICFDFLKRIIPHTQSDSILQGPTTTTEPPHHLERPSNQSPDGAVLLSREYPPASRSSSPDKRSPQ